MQRRKLDLARKLALGGIATMLFVAASLASDRPLRQTDIPKGPGLSISKFPGLVIPFVDVRRGRKLFASKGCVICHEINGVGGRSGRNLNAPTGVGLLSPFDFAARMWLGAPAMAALQEKEVGYQIFLTGQELADIAAFAQDANEQHKFSIHDVPPSMRMLMQKHRL